ncbi:MAG: hypothetical protein ABID40_03145 [Candidatus Bipolaricaulota bacterium]
MDEDRDEGITPEGITEAVESAVLAAARTPGHGVCVGEFVRRDARVDDAEAWRQASMAARFAADAVIAYREGGPKRLAGDFQEVQLCVEFIEQLPLSRRTRLARTVARLAQVVVNEMVQEFVGAALGETEPQTGAPEGGVRRAPQEEKENPR